METLIRFDVLILIPLSLLGLAAAIVLLVLQREKNGVRPPRARGYRVAAILLFVFAAVPLAVIPLLYLASLLYRFLPGFLYSFFKSL
ncbi:MAG: hypothetical protein IJR89_08775 [Clostridia bacterium]|nr:hypothetical protein [Clostridia bacterium]